MINTNQSQQKDTNISCINSKFFYNRVCIINQTSLIYWNSILRILIFLNESHKFKNLIKHNIINFVMNRKIDIQIFKYIKIFSNKLLSCILLIVQIQCFLRFLRFRLIRVKNVLTLLLTTQSITIEKLLNRCLSRHLFTLFWNIWMKSIFNV